LNKKNPKIVAVLPMRFKSERIIAKQLQPVGNYSILELLVYQLKKSHLIHEIVFAISQNIGAELYVNLAKKMKVKYILGNEEDVLGRLIKGAKKANADIVLRTTAENPFIYWEGIDSLIQKHLENDCDFSYHKDLPLGAGMEIINLQTLQYVHRIGKKKHRGELSTLYIYQNPKKFKINEIKPEKLLQRPDLRLTVDTPEDLIVARMIQKGLKIKKQPISLLKIINFLDKNSKIKKINSKISLKYTRFM